MHFTAPRTHPCRQPLQCDLHPLVAEHRGGTDWPRNDPNRTCRTQEVPFIAGCSHFTRKNTRFRAPASSRTQAPRNIHATITMRFAAITMRFASTCCRTQRRNRLTSKRSKPHPPHTGGTLHGRLQPTYMEKHTVSCSGFLPNTSPMQHSCSHYNAFCSTTYTSMQAAITMRFASTRCRTQRRNRWPRNDPNRTRRTQEVPFIAGCSHFTRKNTRFRAPASSPKTSPMQHSCSH